MNDAAATRRQSIIKIDLHIDRTVAARESAAGEATSRGCDRSQRPRHDIECVCGALIDPAGYVRVNAVLPEPA